MTKIHDAPALPTKFIVSGRTYEPVPFLKEGERYVSGNTMLKRAKKFNANLGIKDGQFILGHQDEIPQEYQGEIYLVFTAWRDPSDKLCVVCLDWSGVSWCQNWRWLHSKWRGGRARLVRSCK